jgi:hypothetical protein
VITMLAEVDLEGGLPFCVFCEGRGGSSIAAELRRKNDLVAEGHGDFPGAGQHISWLWAARINFNIKIKGGGQKHPPYAGLIRFRPCTHGLRRGLYSAAASRLLRVVAFHFFIGCLVATQALDAGPFTKSIYDAGIVTLERALPGFARLDSRGRLSPRGYCRNVVVAFLRAKTERR